MTVTDESKGRFSSVEATSRPGLGTAKEDATGWAYNEAAFHYFLALEQKRSEHAGRVFALLLVDRQEGGATVGFEADAASRLFAAFRQCVRDTDFVGWYEEGLVIGAVLTHQAEEMTTSVQRIIEERFASTIRESLQRDGGARIQVRLFQPSMSTKAAGRSCL